MHRKDDIVPLIKASIMWVVVLLPCRHNVFGSAVGHITRKCYCAIHETNVWTCSHRYNSHD